MVMKYWWYSFWSEILRDKDLFHNDRQTLCGCQQCRTNPNPISTQVEILQRRQLMHLSWRVNPWDWLISIPYVSWEETGTEIWESNRVLNLPCRCRELFLFIIATGSELTPQMWRTMYIQPCSTNMIYSFGVGGSAYGAIWPFLAKKMP